MVETGGATPQRHGSEDVLSTQEIAAIWKSHSYIPYKWKRATMQAGAIGGHGTGFWAHCTEVPHRRVYLKPQRRINTNSSARAAREKIASDLASEVGCCVPPAVLTTYQNNELQINIELCASLGMFEQQFSWEDVEARLQLGRFPQLRTCIGQIAPSASARALAFDTWVDQFDHCEPPNHNILLGFDQDPAKGGMLVFLDYSSALGGANRWKSNETNKPPVMIAPFPDYLYERIDQSELRQAIGAIEALPTEAIRTIVQRIPPSFLEPGEGIHITESLLYRQEQLRTTFHQYIQGGVA